MKWILLCIAALVGSSIAHAEVFDPQVADVCTPVPTPGHPGRVNPRSLIGLLLKNQGIADIDIDATGADVGYSQKADAVISGSDFCSRSGSYCGKNTKTQLDSAQEILVVYMQRHLVPVPPGASGYQFSFKLTTANLRDFFLNPSSKLVPSCVAATGPAGTAPFKSPVSTSRIPGRLVIRRNISDLPIVQSDDAFKGLQQATLSLSRDYILSNTTYNIQGVVGYGFGQSPIAPGTFAEIIPFVAYMGQFVDGANPNKVSTVNNLGEGVTADFLFPATSVLYNDVQGTIEEVHSFVSATDILSAKLTYSPYVDPVFVRGIGTAERLGDFLLLLTPQGVFILGDVLHNGSDVNLNRTGTYQRIGTHIAFSATADTGVLNGFGFTASYDYLRSYGGPVSNIDLFTTGGELHDATARLLEREATIPRLGRNLDTLVNQKLITLGVGLKY